MGGVYYIVDTTRRGGRARLGGDDLGSREPNRDPRTHPVLSVTHRLTSSPSDRYIVALR